MTFFQYLCSGSRLPRIAKVVNKTHKNKNMRQIRVTPNERERLQERFKCGKNYVQQVLSFSKNGPTAEKIRRAALELGGRYVDPDFAPNCRTQYLGGRIIQTFADQVVLEIEKETGNIKLTHHGVVVENLEKESMAVWNAMAMKAQMIAENAMVARKDS